MNNYGSRKVPQWKLDIQHYNAMIEHVKDVLLNTPVDVFSRLVEKYTTVSHIMILKCSEAHRGLIKKFHKLQFAHSGVERTIALLTQHCPEETSGLVCETM